MTQTRLGSLIEVWFNIVIGFSINFVANMWLLPLFLHVELSAATNWWLGCAYTVVSVVRGYVIRRWFNAKLHAASMRLAGVKP